MAALPRCASTRSELAVQTIPCPGTQTGQVDRRTFTRSGADRAAVRSAFVSILTANSGPLENLPDGFE